MEQLLELVESVRIRFAEQAADLINRMGVKDWLVGEVFIEAGLSVWLAGHYGTKVISARLRMLAEQVDKRGESENA